MEKFCGTVFWDESLTWNTETPDFTQCFQKTALVWIPCGFLWLFAPIEFYTQIRRKAKSQPWTGLTIFKLFLTVCLIGFSLSDMIYDVVLYLDNLLIYPADYYAGFVKSSTYILVCIMIYMGKVHGNYTSGIQFIFWLLMSVSEIVVFRSILLQVFSDEVSYPMHNSYAFVVMTLTSTIVIAQFVLNAFADKGPAYEKILKKKCPENASSFLSKATFSWLNSIILLGYKQPLKLENLWDLDRKYKSETVFNKFKLFWKPKTPEQLLKEDAVHGAQTKFEIDFSELQRRKSPGLIISVLRTFSLDFLISGLLRLISIIFTFANPILLSLLISFVGGNEPYWRGFLYAVLIFFTSMFESLFKCYSDYMTILISMKVRSCLISALIRKVLVLSSTARKSYTVGNIVNLMSVDVERIMEQVHVFPDLWATPLQIGIAVYMLWQQIGVSTLAGIGIMILLIPLNGWVTTKMKNILVKLMKEKDKRTKLMNEILNGIKVLKLYAWEESFQERIMATRRKEIQHLTTKAYYSAFVLFIFSGAPFLVSLFSFAMFVLISAENVLDANKAFVSLSLFNIIRLPFGILPMLITYTAMFLVSLRRVSKFVNDDELDPSAISHNESRDVPVSIENGSFSWSKSENALLKNINIRINEGSLVAIIGQVGAGKSSLLSALLGEMEKVSGDVNVTGSVAYVPQQAWIQNTTLKKNILFTSEFCEKRYKKTIEACCLYPDLEILPDRDETEIGEKGINLSGGQKQRVGLARAIYNDASIYFFDDPLSAVDSHVGKAIFDNVIGNNGFLHNKTRLLVTHRVAVLPFVDYVIVMKDGEVTEMGTYSELLSQKGAFAEYLVQYLTSGRMDEEEFMSEELQIFENIVTTVEIPELQRQLSRLSNQENQEQEENEREGVKLLHQVSRISQTNALKEKPESLLSVFKSQKQFSKKSKLIDEEAVEIGSVKWSIYLSYIKACGKYHFLGAVCIYMISSVFFMFSNIWLSAWSNDALDPANTGNIALRNLRLLVYGALGAGEILCSVFAILLLSVICLRAAREIHDQALDHILRAPMSFFDTTPTGRILNRFTKDVDSLDITIRMKFGSFILSFFRTVTSILIIALQSGLILVIVLPLGCFYYVVQMYYIATSRQVKRLESISKSPIYTHFTETIAGSSSIRAFKATDTFVLQSDCLVDANNKSYFLMVATNRWLEIRLEFLGYCITFFAALFAVLFEDSISPGLAGLTISCAMMVTLLLNYLVRATCDIENSVVSVERCLEYTQTPTEAPRVITEEAEPNSDWPSHGCIQFERYAVRYREGLDLVLNGITCTFQPMEKVGIVGRTGAGKSSLTLSIFRLIEAASGCIRIDGIDISHLGLYSLRSKLTIIPQDPFLFAGTLRLNIDPFENHTDQEIYDTLHHAHLYSFVSSLEKGLQYEVTEGGENLSVGQRQLICLCRALLRKTKILVMDEATAAVDMETDELIQMTIRTEFSDCTILTIAHRLNTIMDYDRVMVLDRGQIIEFDSPSNLLKDCTSAFYDMAKDANIVS